MAGIFITFEGTEGSGKSTQVDLLAARLRGSGHIVRTLREPGGTPIGEEIRHLLKHSEANRAMTPETELLLMNASRAQLVREVILPALAAGEIVLCDRFYDSTIAYQGYGRRLDLSMVRSVIHAAVGGIQPGLTLLLVVPVEVSERRRLSRQRSLAESAASGNERGAAVQKRDTYLRDRMEEADRAFFERVELGFREISARNSERMHVIDASREVLAVQASVFAAVTERWPSLGSVE